jgi:hypothetical protein
VRDDYAGWHQFDEHAAGVQQCVAHLFRHLQGVLDLHPTQQTWAGKARDVLREAHTAVEAAKVATATELDPVSLTGLRARYDKAVTWGQTTNRHRDWDGKGNHPVGKDAVGAFVQLEHVVEVARVDVHVKEE